MQVTIEVSPAQLEFLKRAAKAMEDNGGSGTLQAAVLKLMELGYGDFLYKYKPGAEPEKAQHLHIVK